MTTDVAAPASERTALIADGPRTSLVALRYVVHKRSRPDPMSISAPTDFRFEAAEEVDAEAVLNDPAVTLYCIDAKRGEALFVECDPAAELEHFPFYYQGQYQHARRAVVMSLEVMHEVAARRGDRFDTAVMIHSVGRCGSTLLSKMFARLGNCFSLSEPDVYTQLLTEADAPKDSVGVLRSTNRLYFQPNGNVTPSHLILKFRSFCIELAKEMELATPSARSLFLYRDAESVVRSGLRVFCYDKAPLWWVNQLHKWIITRPALFIGLGWNRGIGRRIFPALDRFSIWELSRMGPVGILAAAWVSAMERCVKLLEDGLQLPAFRYEDLVAQPESTLDRLIRHCQLPPESLAKMLGALEGDSQRNSVISRQHQREIELSQRDKDTIRMVLSKSDIIDGVDFEIAGSSVV